MKGRNKLFWCIKYIYELIFEDDGYDSLFVPTLITPKCNILARIDNCLQIHVDNVKYNN